MKRSSERRLRERRGFPAPPTPPGGAGSINWVSLGPTKVDGGQAGAVHAVVSGRVTSIAVGPSGTRVYVGTANGGVWITEDGGTNWTALDEFANAPAGGAGTIASNLEADSLAVGAVAVRFGAARASDVIFVGTGEPGGNADGYFGIGIKSSADGGTTFSLEATNLVSREIYRIVIDPDDPTIVFAATTNGLYQRPASAPFTSWNQIAGSFTSASGAASDVVVAGKGGKKKQQQGVGCGTGFKKAEFVGAWNGGGGVLWPGGKDPSARTKNMPMGCFPPSVGTH